MIKTEHYRSPNVPTVHDFKPAAIQKALFRNANSFWVSRYSVPVFFGTVVYSSLFGFSYGNFLALLGIFGIGAGTWIYKYYFKADRFKRDYVNELNQIIADNANQKLVNLEQNLSEFNNSHAVNQINQFLKKKQVLTEILKSKFDENTLTFARYFGIAQEVYLSGIDNLVDIHLAHKTIQGIDIDYISNRMKKLENLETISNVDKKEIEALERSLDSHKIQHEKIKQLLTENELALSQLDETTIAISEINKSKDRQAEIDMENSMKALTELKERSKFYSK